MFISGEQYATLLKKNEVGRKHMSQSLKGIFLMSGLKQWSPLGQEI